MADCVEALIGCYLTAASEVAALRFMDWLGLHVVDKHTEPLPEELEVTTKQKLMFRKA